MRRPTLLALLLLVPSAAQAQGEAARVDSIFARFGAPGSPGCAVAVGRDGAPLLARAYGMADLEHDVPNTPETVFEAGSVSKQFTAAAVVLLAQQGKLGLDDEARKYVPELPVYQKPITIRHLLNHTSGLRDWGTVVEVAGWPRGSRAHTHAHVLDVVSRQKSLNFAPGAEYLYSNTGYNLLAIIAERVSGEKFADFTRRTLFQPLGMTRTRWRSDYTEVVKGRAVAYDTAGGAFHMAMPFEDVHGNGGLLTTVGDLLTWNEALTHGRVGAAGFSDELQRRGVLTGGRRIQYAHGLVVSEYRGVPEVSHSGATAGYRAYLARYPAQKLSVALLCNSATASPVALGYQVADVFLAGHTRDPQAAAPVALTAAELSERAGMYRNRRTGEPLRLSVRDGKLRNGAGAELVPLSATRFRLGRGPAQVVFDDAPTRRAALRLLASDGDTVAFEPVPEAAAVRPAELAGEYRSDEAEVTYTVASDSGRLVLRRRPDTTLPLTPAYADAFTTPDGWLVRFTRD
ncbi:MAG: beta-lactamase family protein, partial [Gemmatimonadetes bacterium]|nr:beta-lactamase family protein [Gemmatimonadota bacterium]